MGGDWRERARAAESKLVSTRAPAWGATCVVSGTLSRRCWFQLAPPRGGRRVRRGLLFAIIMVSTRAPAWGATSVSVHVVFEAVVSTRAPAWGATLIPTVRRGGRFGFQLAPPRGGRLIETSVQLNGSEVSTRAPAWGATYAATDWAAGGDGFNSRPRVGGDWNTRSSRSWALTSFNSRPRVGGDPPSASCKEARTMFQLAPPRGGRPDPARLKVEEFMFQLAPPRGGRQEAALPMAVSSWFQLAPPRGGRLPAHCQPSTDQHRFNSRPRVGGDLLGDVESSSDALVSTRAPAWGAT